MIMIPVTLTKVKESKFCFKNVTREKDEKEMVKETKYEFG